MEPNKSSRVLKWSIIIGIVIVINLFFNYTLSLFYQEPQYEAFCPINATQPVDSSGNLPPGATLAPSIQDGLPPGATLVPSTNSGNPSSGLPSGMTLNPTTPQPSLDSFVETTCNQNFNSAQNVYDRNAFIILVILGALCVAVGSFFNGNIVLSQSLSIAGVLSFIIASGRYWSSADNLIKVIILAIALALLVWVAMRKFKQ